MSSEQPSEGGPVVDFEGPDDSASVDLPEWGTPFGKTVYLLGLVTAVFAVYFLWVRPLPQAQYSNLHLGLMLLLFFGLQFYQYRKGERDRRQSASLLVFGAVVAVGVVGVVVIHFQYDRLAFSAFGRFLPLEYAAAAMVVLSVVYATKRAFGWIITSVVVLTLVFARFGQYFPGVLRHQGFEVTQILEFGVLQFTGVYHMLFQIGATWIFIFLVWAGLIQEHDFLDTLFQIGFLVGSKFKSGVAQSAVVTSMFMGGVSGSPLANIAVTGSFTIPLMKERGISGKLAGGIESVASTGGLVLPPIMGSVAFIMANFLGVPYGDIIIAAALPALLFYLAVGLAVHLTVIQLDLDTSIRYDIDGREILWESIPILASLLVLLYQLVQLRAPPGVAGLWAIGILLLFELGKQLVEAGEVAAVPQAAVEFVRSTARGLVNGSVRMAPLTVVLAGMGLVITTFNTTGTGFRLSLEIVNIAGQNVFILLVLVMLSSIFLGMGMPSVAAYLITVTLIAPAMVEFGFETLTAHFFVFYFSIIATITPPVALGPAVASQISGADYIETAVEAVKIGFPLFLIPFVFAFNQSLVVTDGLNSILTFLVTLVGFLVMVYGLHSGIDHSRRSLRVGVKLGSIVGGFGIIFHSQLLTFLL